MDLYLNLFREVSKRKYENRARENLIEDLIRIVLRVFCELKIPKGGSLANIVGVLQTKRGATFSEIKG